MTAPVEIENYDEAKAAWMRASTPVMAVAQASPDLPTTFILDYAVKVARVMEGLLDKEGREWSIALAAEAMFDLTTKHKDPLPTHTLRLPYSEEPAYLPALLARVLDKSSSELRRMMEAGAVRVGMTRVGLNELSPTRLIGCTIHVGKQGTAILVLPADS